MSALDMPRLRAELATDYSLIDYVESTGSTNTDLMSADNVADGTVLLADEQTSGKGRLGRVWTAPAGTQVILSVLLLPDDLDNLGTLPLAAGLAVTDSIDGAVLKWPNDVHIDGKKLCGILAEAGPVGAAFKSGAPKVEGASKTEFAGKTEVAPKTEGAPKTETAPKLEGASAPGARVVLGMGINVSLTREQLPIEQATSLALEGHEADRTEVAIAVLRNLRRRIIQWEAQDPQLMEDYRRVCSSIGKQVRLEAPTGNVEGRVNSVADDGRIQVGEELYSAGDVIHLRAQS